MNTETLAVDEIKTTTTTTLKSNKPEWIRVKLPTGKKYTELRSVVDRYNLHTICTSGSCVSPWQMARLMFLTAWKILRGLPKKLCLRVKWTLMPSARMSSGGLPSMGSFMPLGTEWMSWVV